MRSAGICGASMLGSFRRRFQPSIQFQGVEARATSPAGEVQPDRMLDAPRRAALRSRGRKRFPEKTAGGGSRSDPAESEKRGEKRRRKKKNQKKEKKRVRNKKRCQQLRNKKEEARSQGAAEKEGRQEHGVGSQLSSKGVLVLHFLLMLGHYPFWG